jgi:hypothetical protein
LGGLRGDAPGGFRDLKAKSVQDSAYLLMPGWCRSVRCLID